MKGIILTAILSLIIPYSSQQDGSVKNMPSGNSITAEAHYKLPALE